MHFDRERQRLAGKDCIELSIGGGEQSLAERFSLIGVWIWLSWQPKKRGQ